MHYITCNGNLKTIQLSDKFRDFTHILVTFFLNFDVTRSTSLKHTQNSTFYIQIYFKVIAQTVPYDGTLQVTFYMIHYSFIDSSIKVLDVVSHLVKIYISESVSRPRPQISCTCHTSQSTENILPARY